MLHKVIIENFYSVSYRQEILFKVAKNAPDKPCFKTSLERAEQRTPAVAVFFGHNASGKTTVLKAITLALLFAANSVEWQKLYIFQAYRQKKWLSKPTKIIIEFDMKLSEDSEISLFRYELHINNNPDNFNEKTVSYEALFYSPKGKFKRLFERKNQDFYFGKEFNIPLRNDSRVTAIRNNASVISTLAMLNHSISIGIKNIINNMQLDKSFLHIPEDHPKIKVENLIKFYKNNKRCFDQLNKTISKLDLGIEKMEIAETNNGLLAQFEHYGLDGPTYYFEESVGTRKIIEVFPFIYNALEEGSIVIIDELDVNLHPLLIPLIVNLFNDTSNKNNAQLLFSAHNVVILDHLEKEQIFLVEKKEKGSASEVFCAANIKELRRSPSLMKKYISGELKAIPRLAKNNELL